MAAIQRVTVATLALFVLTSCEDKTETDLYKAQICIDKATAANVNTCTNLIAGDESERAYVLRCSAAFISEGIDEDAIVDALENIDGEGNGDPTTPALAALAMSSTTASVAALSDCEKSNSDGLIALANFANVATAMTTLLGLTGDITQAQIDAALASYNPNDAQYTTAEKEALGAAVIASQDSLCDPTSGSFQGNDACTDINAAIAANPNDSAAVADALIANINNKNN